MPFVTSHKVDMQNCYYSTYFPEVKVEFSRLKFILRLDKHVTVR